MNATRSPIESGRAITWRPPSQSTTSAPTPPTTFITGPMKPRTRASRRFASWKRALSAAKRRQLVLLGGVRLHDVDAGEVLLHAARQLAEPLLHAQRALHQEPAGALHEQQRERDTPRAPPP